MKKDRIKLWLVILLLLVVAAVWTGNTWFNVGIMVMLVVIAADMIF
jgi:hypothetical protein